MAHECTKCGGSGIIQKFGHIEHGQCFRCMGTGTILTNAERNAILRKRANAHDAQMAREQGVSLEVFQAYVGGPVPKHQNGCSYSIEEFAAWKAAA